jgi:pectinacetylesterase
MKKLSILIFGMLLFIMSTALVGSAVAADALPNLTDLKSGEWNAIAPGGDTICSYGTPYQFFVRPAASPSDKLMIHFEGGGACWDAETCAPDYKFPPDDTGKPLFDRDVSDNEMEGYTGGLFDFSNAENPVADYNTVFVPYCTADVHMGSMTHEYSSSSGEKYTINFQGFTNASAVLDWTYANFDKPSEVFITGISAGAIGQVIHTPYIMDHYKESQVVQFADSYVGVTARGWTGFKEWGALPNVAKAIVPAYSDLTEANFSLARLYKGMVPAFPDNTFSEFTSYLDGTQIFFYFLTGGGATPEEAGGNFVTGRQSIISSLTANLPNFRAYQSWGNIHGITNVDDFYAYQVKGVRLRDWLADLLAGKTPRSVICSSCTTPELYSK